MFYVVLVVLCFCTTASSYTNNIDCHYFYDDKCVLQPNKHNSSYDYLMKPCTIDNIPKEVYYTHILDDKNSTSQGVISVEFMSPNSQCEYKVALFINPEIDNAEACKSVKFNKTNGKVHTVEKNICLVKKNETTISEREKQQTVQVEWTSCKENILGLYYAHIYTGCYALGFKIFDDYIFVNNEFLTSDHKKVEIKEPVTRCTYSPITKENGSSVETVTIAAEVVLLTTALGIKIEIVPTNLLSTEDNDEKLCIANGSPGFSYLAMNLANNNAVDHNCTLTTPSSGGSLVKAVDCNFAIQEAPKNTAYCFVVRILDDRCHKNTLWKPPIQGQFPCAWSHYCKRTEIKRTNSIEEVKKDSDSKPFKMPRILYLILFVAIILIVLAVLSTIIIAYRIHLERTKNIINTRMRKDVEENGGALLEMNGSSTKSQKEKLVKESGIVILYVRETDEFMTFMSEFKKSLEQYTGCDVHDWWAPDLWNDVARVGGYEWVVQMIRQDFRVVWVDTMKARMLFSLQRRNGYNKLRQLKSTWHNQEVMVSDFRDSVFPAIVDFAKRNNQNIDQEYQKHFVIRLETFVDADKTDDPFADLSPHARFLIPCHLDKLCSQLSISESFLESEIKEEKDRLKKYLLQESDVSL